MDKSKVEAHMMRFYDDETTHPEVVRFIKDFLILAEFGQFDGEEEEDEEPYDQ